MSEICEPSGPVLTSTPVPVHVQPVLVPRKNLASAKMPSWLDAPPIRRKLSRVAVAVLFGFDPRTHYPRCDVCGELPPEPARQVGRWSVCAGCLADPNTARLRSLQKPSYPYSTLVQRVLDAIWAISETQTNAESLEAHARLAQLAHESGLVQYHGPIPSKDRTGWKQRVQREERGR